MSNDRFIFRLSSGLLYPRDSESRETKSLDGVWKFRLCPTLDSDIGFREEWFENGIDFEVTDPSEILSMPVPSSYNDISTSAAVRDHVGWAWYERDFFVPQGWKNENLEVRLRFGSVHYIANGKYAKKYVQWRSEYCTSLIFRLYLKWFILL